MRPAGLSVCFLVVAMAGAAAAGAPAILTSPVGLVSGELQVDLDLGVSSTGATLYLDGVDVCSPTPASPTCRIDLGSELHVHLLELAVTTTDGSVERAERWLNRPGREADLEIELASRPIGNVCGGRLAWTDVRGQQPAVLEVEAAGEHIVVLTENRTFGYPCAAIGGTEVVAAAAVFPDGRRASSVALTGDSGRSAGAAPQPVVLEPSFAGASPCAGTESEDWQGFEVAFVLDPSVDYATLASLGDRSGAASGAREFGRLRLGSRLMGFFGCGPHVVRPARLHAASARWFCRESRAVVGDLPPDRIEPDASRPAARRCGGDGRSGCRRRTAPPRRRAGSRGRPDNGQKQIFGCRRCGRISPRSACRLVVVRATGRTPTTAGPRVSRPILSMPLRIRSRGSETGSTPNVWSGFRPASISARFRRSFPVVR